jgi:esterase/lipase superfamily enzyme
LAREKGRQFKSVIEKLNQRAKSLGKQPAFSFLLHSMGNIVFEGLVEGIIKENKLWQTRQVFCCAADLESAVFDGGLRLLPEIAGDVHVLFHAEDKTLRVANMMQPFHRLGIYGREDVNKAQNIHSLDATLISEDDMAVGSRFSHHRYFYGSKNVVRYINEWLSKR